METSDDKPERQDNRQDDSQDPKPDAWTIPAGDANVTSRTNIAKTYEFRTPAEYIHALYEVNVGKNNFHENVAKWYEALVKACDRCDKEHANAAYDHLQESAKDYMFYYSQFVELLESSDVPADIDGVKLRSEADYQLSLINQDLEHGHVVYGDLYKPSDKKADSIEMGSITSDSVYNENLDQNTGTVIRLENPGKHSEVQRSPIPSERKQSEEQPSPIPHDSQHNETQQLPIPTAAGGDEPGRASVDVPRKISILSDRHPDQSGRALTDTQGELKSVSQVGSQCSHVSVTSSLAKMRLETKQARIDKELDFKLAAQLEESKKKALDLQTQMLQIELQKVQISQESQKLAVEAERARQREINLEKAIQDNISAHSSVVSSKSGASGHRKSQMAELPKESLSQDEKIQKFLSDSLSVEGFGIGNTSFMQVPPLRKKSVLEEKHETDMSHDLGAVHDGSIFRMPKSHSLDFSVTPRRLDFKALTLTL